MTVAELKARKAELEKYLTSPTCYEGEVAYICEEIEAIDRKLIQILIQRME